MARELTITATAPLCMMYCMSIGFARDELRAIELCPKHRLTRHIMRRAAADYLVDVRIVTDLTLL
jgi:hypothetical protein